jgi:hypothetical protein
MFEAGSKRGLQEVTSPRGVTSPWGNLTAFQQAKRMTSSSLHHGTPWNILEESRQKQHGEIQRTRSSGSSLLFSYIYMLHLPQGG